MNDYDVMDVLCCHWSVKSSDPSYFRFHPIIEMSRSIRYSAG